MTYAACVPHVQLDTPDQTHQQDEVLFTALLSETEVPRLEFLLPHLVIFQ